MKHPRETELALHAGGDLPAWKRLLLTLHLRRCPECARAAEAFRSDREVASDSGARLPPAVDWDYLAAEMKANIQVGLAAGECVNPSREKPVHLGWRPAVAVACAMVVIVGGWWLHLPRPAAERAEGAFLTATADGLELFQEEDRALTIIHESSDPVMLSASVDGTMSAHYVDDETGMVTINNVYSQ